MDRPTPQWNEKLVLQLLNCLMKVQAFNEIAGNFDKPVSYDLEYALLKEEVLEYYEAQVNGDIVGTKDAMADIQFVLLGTVMKHGFGTFFSDLEKVCKSNLTKFCKTREEAEATMMHYAKKYEAEGLSGEGIESNYNEKYRVWVVTRPDGKILKSIMYEPVNLQ